MFLGCVAVFFATIAAAFLLGGVAWVTLVSGPDVAVAVAFFAVAGVFLVSGSLVLRYALKHYWAEQGLTALGLVTGIARRPLIAVRSSAPVRRNRSGHLFPWRVRTEWRGWLLERRSEKALTSPGGLWVRAAIYGPDGRDAPPFGADATDRIQGYVQDDRLKFEVTNGTVMGEGGPDPFLNIVKSLWIEYQMNGGPVQTSITTEGGTVDLP